MSGDVVSGAVRKAFVMQLNPGQETEYERRHQAVWPELERVLVDSGVHTYSIFLSPETLQLFAYVEFESEERWQQVASTEACRRWWAYMKDIMPSNPDNSPVSAPLREVYHLRGSAPDLQLTSIPRHLPA